MATLVKYWQISGRLHASLAVGPHLYSRLRQKKCCLSQSIRGILCVTPSRRTLFCCDPDHVEVFLGEHVDVLD